MNFRLPAMLLALALASAPVFAQRGAPRAPSTPRTSNGPRQPAASKRAPSDSDGPPAIAQISFYGDFQASFHNEFGVYVHPVAGQDNTRSSLLFGPTLGGSIDFNRLGPVNFAKVTKPVTIGFDVRETVLRGAGYDRDSTLFGVRAVSRSNYFHGKPYLEAAMGIGHVSIPTIPNFQNKMEYGAFLGIDHKFKKNIDWRMLEVGAVTLNRYTPYNAAQQNNYMVSLSTGIVVRLK